MVALTVCQFVVVRTTFFGLLVLGLLVMMAVVIPACVFFERSLFADFDRCGSLGLSLPLKWRSRQSSGG